MSLFIIRTSTDPYNSFGFICAFYLQVCKFYSFELNNQDPNEYNQIIKINQKNRANQIQYDVIL